MAKQKAVVPVIQARTTSSRFPGKVKTLIGRETMLGKIINTLYRCEHIDRVVLATPLSESNEKLREYADFYSVLLHRGDENDVLKRIVDAAEYYGVKHVLRVCADSPFLIPWVIDYAIDVYQDSDVSYLYTTGLPKGCNVEIIPTRILKEIHKKASDEEKEHVTLYIENNLIRFKTKELDLSDLSIDEDKQLNKLQKLAKYYDKF